MNIRDLHFKNIRDIADNFKENARMFAENREFEHLLLIAVPGIICIYIGIDRFKCCKNGKMAVYLFKNKTEYVKLKD